MKRAVRVLVLIVASVECYKLRILNITECRVPDPPMMKNVREQWSGTIEPYTERDKMLLRGNVTVLRDVRFYARFKMAERQKRYNNIVTFKGITCRNIITKMLMQFTNIMYDPNECKVLKGNYVFEVNKLIFSIFISPVPTLRPYLTVSLLNVTRVQIDRSLTA